MLFVNREKFLGQYSGGGSEWQTNLGRIETQSLPGTLKFVGRIPIEYKGRRSRSECDGSGELVWKGPDIAAGGA
jgi:hypothetical protein